MSDSRGFEPPLGDEIEALLRLIRSARPSGEGGLELVDEEALVAYVSGRASSSQVEQIQAAMARSASFRRQLLDLMRLAEEPVTEAEREAFDQATAPPAMSHPQLREVSNQAPASVRSLPPRPRRRWLEWVLGGWATAATAAACTLLVTMSRPRSEGPVAPAPGASPSEPVQPFRESGKYSLTVPPTVRLRGPSRGGGEGAAVVTVGPSTKILRIMADPPDVPNGSQVTVRLMGPGGRVLLDEAHPVEDLFGTEVLTLQAPEPLAAGRYVLVIGWMEDSQPQSISLPFVIRISEN